MEVSQMAVWNGSVTLLCKWQLLNNELGVWMVVHNQPKERGIHDWAW